MKLKQIFENTQNKPTKSQIFLRLSKYFRNIRLSQIKINDNEISYTGYLTAVREIDTQTFSSMPRMIITRLPSPPLYDLLLDDCQILTSLDGIQKITVVDRTPLKVHIVNCPALIWDPYELAVNYNLKINIAGQLPSNTRIVKTIALDPRGDQVTWNFATMPYGLLKIIETNRGKEADMPHLALELARAGFRGHAGLT